MSNIDKQALNQEKIEWLNKLADMEYCKSNPWHWLMSLKDTNMLAKLALRSVALLDEIAELEQRHCGTALLEREEMHTKTLGRMLDELDAKDKQIADLKEAFSIALSAAGIDVPTAAGKGE